MRAVPWCEIFSHRSGSVGEMLQQDAEAYDPPRGPRALYQPRFSAEIDNETW